jgi:hypothetical protein
VSISDEELQKRVGRMWFPPIPLELDPGPFNDRDVVIRKVIYEALCDLREELGHA